MNAELKKCLLTIAETVIKRKYKHKTRVGAKLKS